MALEDLIIDQKDISHELMEKILKGHVELVKNNKGVHLTEKAQKFSSKTKILLFLCGKKAWDLIENLTEPTTTNLDELGQGVSIFSSTLRTALLGLKNDYLVNSLAQGKYYITSKGAFELQVFLKDEEDRPQSETISKSKGKRTKGSKGRVEIVKKFTGIKLDKDYISLMHSVFKNAKNIDKYILAIHIAEDKIGLEGLTPPEVHLFLTEPPINLPNTFHVSNISRDLGRARQFVNPYRVGNAFEYRLNSLGHDYIKKLLNPEPSLEN